MNVGTDELSRAAAAYAACLVFVVAFLVATLTGSGGFTAILRGGIAAFATFLVARPLLRPLLSTVVAALVRDQAQKAKKAGEAAE